jgi:hypothetical protein
MFVGADYYISHNDEAEQKTSPITFENMPLNKFTDIVSKASLSNTDRANDAIAKADSYSFQTVFPEFLPTENNQRIINHWLTTHNITNPTYPDYVAGYEAFKDSGLLDLDAAELARDRSTGRTFTGVFTKQKFDTVDGLIGAERRAAIAQGAPISDEQRDFENNVPLNMLRDAERAAQQQANRAEVQDAADSWLILRPEWRDDTRNGKLMRAQLKDNGVTQPTIADYEHAAQQLRASGLVALNPKQVEKQHAKQLQERANEAAKQLFDDTNEQEAWELSLEELKRRANGNFSGVGV